MLGIQSLNRIRRRNQFVKRARLQSLPWAKPNGATKGQTQAGLQPRRSVAAIRDIEQDNLCVFDILRSKQ